MSRILVIAFVTLAAGSAYAQQSPFLQGDYSVNVGNSYNPPAAVGQVEAERSVVVTHSTDIASSMSGDIREDAPALPILLRGKNYSGR